jgi:hypothetical protein
MNQPCNKAYPDIASSSALELSVKYTDKSLLESLVLVLSRDKPVTRALATIVNGERSEYAQDQLIVVVQGDIYPESKGCLCP